MFRTIVFIFLLTTAAFDAAAQQKTADPNDVGQTPNGKTVTADDSAQVPVKSSNATAARYRLQPSDVLDVKYVYSPEYDRKGVVVQPDGYISLELVGNVRVAGLTVDEVQKRITHLASERLNEPEITVILTDFVKPYFVIAGEVPTPGKMELRDNTSALQGVLLAGGFKESAKSSQIILYRRYNDEFVETKVIKLDDYKRKGQMRDDIMLQPGDMLYVPRNNIAKIERFARTASVLSIFRFLF